MSEDITKEEFWYALTTVPVSDRNCENCDWFDDVESLCREPVHRAKEIYTCHFNVDDTMFDPTYANKHRVSLQMWKPKK